MTKELTIEEVEFIAHDLAKEWMSWDEPIPDFSTRFPGTLESCLGTPFQTFGKRLLYQGIMNQASILFYLLVKNHPFQNGNKRIAITSLMVFLYGNRKWLDVDIQEFYNFAVWVAASPPKLKDETVNAVHAFIKRYIVDLKKSKI